jgi:hypothetical protein
MMEGWGGPKSVLRSLADHFAIQNSKSDCIDQARLRPMLRMACIKLLMEFSAVGASTRRA